MHSKETRFTAQINNFPAVYTEEKKEKSFSYSNLTIIQTYKIKALHK